MFSRTVNILKCQLISNNSPEVTELIISLNAANYSFSKFSIKYEYVLETHNYISFV